MYEFTRISSIYIHLSGKKHLFAVEKDCGRHKSNYSKHRDLYYQNLEIRNGMSYYLNILICNILICYNIQSHCLFYYYYYYPSANKILKFCVVVHMY